MAGSKKSKKKNADEGVEPMERLHRIDTATGKVLAVAFRPDHNQVAAGTRDGMVTIYDCDSGEVVQRLKGHREFVYCMAWHPEGALLLSSGKDRTMRVWDVDNGELDRDLAGLVTGAKARTMYGSMGHSGSGHTKTPLSVTFNEDGSLIGSGGQDQLVKLWEEGRVQRTFNWHGGPVTAVQFRPGTDELMSASRDGTIRTWNRHTGSMINKYVGHRDEIEDAIWLDRTRIASGDISGALALWSLGNEQPEATVRERSAVRCLAASSDGDIFYAGLENPQHGCRCGRRAARKRRKRRLPLHLATVSAD